MAPNRYQSVKRSQGFNRTDIKSRKRNNRLNAQYGMVSSRLYGRGRYLHRESEQAADTGPDVIKRGAA